MNAKETMRSARTALVLDQPFFGTLALRLNVIEDPGCGTAWVDGVTLGYDPEFVKNLNHSEVVALIAHEVMHCACGHPWRKDAREHKRWNVACDFAINEILTKAGFRLPAGALLDPKYNGKSAEWIYDRLEQDYPQGKCLGEVRPAPSQDGEGKGQGGAGDQPGVTAEDWAVAVQQAAATAKAMGNLPAAIERFVGDAAETKVDWRTVLRRFVQQATKSDYTWRQPSARYRAAGLYLPSLHSEQLGPIAVAIDTSGSIDGVLLSQFNSELQAIVSEARPSKVLVLYCDAKVHRVDTFEDGDPVTLHAVGGGGTDFRPVFAELAKMEESPVCLIYLTDMYGTFPKTSEVPTLWASTTKTQAPFGEVVQIQ